MNENKDCGCLLCANGNDIGSPEEYCRACGYGLPKLVNDKTEQAESNLSKAVKAARGGEHSTPFRGYA